MPVNSSASRLNQQFAVLNQKIAAFFRFIGDKLKNFKNLTWGEQVAYSVIGVGILLILTSMIMFMV